MSVFVKMFVVLVIFVCFIYNMMDMKLESVGLLINLRPFNERDCVARIFTREYGVLVGMMRGAVVAKKNRPLLGQVGAAVWNARLDTQLGVFHWDAEKNLSAPLMLDSARLMCMNVAFDILGVLLPERESYQTLYDDTCLMCQKLVCGNMGAYLEWEIGLLRELGYALDLSHCSGCGGVENLCYLSPRTGRAVCGDCGAPYVNKLYPLPVNLSVTLRFLESICAQQGVDVPYMRRMLKLV